MFSAAKRMQSVLMPPPPFWGNEEIFRQVWAANSQPPPRIVVLDLDAPDNNATNNVDDNNVALTLATAFTSFWVLQSLSHQQPKTVDVVSGYLCEATLIAGVCSLMYEWYNYCHYHSRRQRRGSNGGGGGGEGSNHRGREHGRPGVRAVAAVYDMYINYRRRLPSPQGIAQPQ